MGKGRKRSKKKAKPARTGSADGGVAADPTPAPRPSSGGAAGAANAPVADHECINCDNCGIANPQKCCSRCFSFYYCSKECQLKDWKHHKHECATLKDKRDHYNAARDRNNLPGGTPAAIDDPCAICLEEEVKHPVTFECGHAFCFGCIVTYQSTDEQPKCPYCRGEIPNVLGNACDRYDLYGYRALVAEEKSEERKKYCQLAMAEHDALSQLFKPQSLLYLKANIISLSEDPEELLKVTDEMLSRIQSRDLDLDHEEVVRTKLWRAQAYSEMGKWAEASEIYLGLRTKDQLHNPLNQFLLEMRHCRCLFELGDYHRAVESGNRAVKMGRTRPGVHEYLARAQKAAGNIDAATNTMARAILHEEPWDVENKKKNKQILKDL